MLEGTQPKPRPSLQDSVFNPGCALLVFVFAALLRPMFLLAWSPALLTGFLVARLLLLLLTGSLFLIRGALIVL
jgi:hypothetical protein